MTPFEHRVEMDKIFYKMEAAKQKALECKQKGEVKKACEIMAVVPELVEKYRFHESQIKNQLNKGFMMKLIVSEDLYSVEIDGKCYFLPETSTEVGHGYEMADARKLTGKYYFVESLSYDNNMNAQKTRSIVRENDSYLLGTNEVEITKLAEIEFKNVSFNKNTLDLNGYDIFFKKLTKSIEFKLPEQYARTVNYRK